MDKIINNRKRLSAYSKFAIAVLVMKPSIGLSEVVYTDIEPDVVLANDNDGYILDLNNDSFNDFEFLNRSFEIGGYWTSGSIYYIPFNNFERIIGTALFDNSFAANSVDYGTTFSALVRELPFALNSGNVIDELLTFLPDYQQLLAFKTELDLAGELYQYGGYWFPEVIDHYLGVRFQDEDLNTHYGWIRCDVKDSGRTLVLKGYAYETESDKPIVAGDTLSVGINNFLNSLNATVYSFNRQLYIHLNESTETKLSIFDLLGKEILNISNLSNFDVIPLNNYSSGIYIVELRSESGIFRKEISI